MTETESKSDTKISNVVDLHHRLDLTLLNTKHRPTRKQVERSNSNFDKTDRNKFRRLNSTPSEIDRRTTKFLHGKNLKTTLNPINVRREILPKIKSNSTENLSIFVSSQQFKKENIRFVNLNRCSTLDPINGTVLNLLKKQENVDDYPPTPTPPPTMIDHRNQSTNQRSINDEQQNEKNKSRDGNFEELTRIHFHQNFHQGQWTIPATIELSPTSLTSSSSSPDLSIGISNFEEIQFYSNQKDRSRNERNFSSMKSRPRSLSFSAPRFSSTPDGKKSKFSTRSTEIKRKFSFENSIKQEQLDSNRKRIRRRRQQIFNQHPTSIDVIRDLIEQIIENVSENIESERTTSSTLEKSESQKFNRKTSTKTNRNRRKRKLDFKEKSIDTKNETTKQKEKVQFSSQQNSSLFDERANIVRSTEPNNLKKNISNEIIRELVEGTKGLDKLFCSLNELESSVENFTRLNFDQQSENIRKLEQQLEKISMTKFQRASLFCKQKVQYFIEKHSIESSDKFIEEISLIVKYFYLFILELRIKKQQQSVETNSNETNENISNLNDQRIVSSILTDFIENFILKSSFSNEYLGAQPLSIDQVDHDLPWLRNVELENEILNDNQISLATNQFEDFNDLQNFLDRFRHSSPSTPNPSTENVQSPTIYHQQYPTNSYPSYYRTVQTNESHPYYYCSTPIYPYLYRHPMNYSHFSTGYQTGFNHDRAHYYYSHPSNNYLFSQPTTTNDIPVNKMNSFHSVYHPLQSSNQPNYG